ncbi:MAG: GIY-YIG nuclease family protein [bacterium]|nr:GIY-YIG nuclease family protein [bacterium]
MYIMASNSHAVLYTGITSDLPKRAYEHREKVVPGFTSRYNVCKLVYYEVYEDPEHAIAREKQIKAGSRKRKIDLIKKMNPAWGDLFASVCG